LQGHFNIVENRFLLNILIASNGIYNSKEFLIHTMRDLNLCEIRAATALHMSIKRASTQRGKKSPVQCDIRLYLSRKQRRHTTCGVI
jgi:hypothetical protein